MWAQLNYVVSVEQDWETFLEIIIAAFWKNAAVLAASKIISIIARQQKKKE